MNDAGLSTSTSVPVFFPAGGDMLFGIMTLPQGRSNGYGVIVQPGLLTFHRNRVYGRLAERLASRGFSVLRFDNHGRGESSGTRESYHLDRPFVGDLEGAVRYLREQGVQRLILVGHCAQARGALALAPRLTDVVGVVCAAVPVGDTSARLARDLTAGDFIRRALHPRTLRRLLRPSLAQVYLRHLWAKGRMLSPAATNASQGHGDGMNRDVLRQLEALARQGTRVLFVFGKDDDYYLTQFQPAREGKLGRLLEENQELMHVKADIPGILHNFRSVTVQEGFLDVVDEWMGEILEGERKELNGLAR
ncbi:MAG: lysophospholipase [Actinomycetota bacterium]|nr:lysophospholipase [Actinomycetota bacterium]